jgi:hypothetical protein
MNQIIIYTDTDGAICIVHPAPGYALETVIASAVPPGTAHHIIDADQLPQDRYFREAWKLEDGALVIDIDKAKDVQRNVWRKLRSPKLTALDLAFMRALEAGNAVAQSEITAQKTALRDVTLTELPNDPEGIRETMPSILI